MSLPQKGHTSPAATPASPDLTEVRGILEGVVRQHARDPANPWAVGHALLALGPDVELTNGQPAVDFLFAEYGKIQRVGETDLVRFPRKRGSIRIEPHTDLLLKAFTESGVPPTRAVRVEGQPFTVAHLYRHSLWRAWIDGNKLSFTSWNDAPWALQSLAAWAPDGLAWRAEGGRDMTLDAMTSQVVAKLHSETAFMREAMAAGTTVQKRRQGIFDYTCGGAHLLQGAAYAVARGFGAEADRALVAGEVPVLFWRFELEMQTVDQALEQYPEHRFLLLEQRLKFLGHFLESTHKLAAMGFFTPDDAQRAVLDRARAELVSTVRTLMADDLFDRLEFVRDKNEQMYLDFVGDSAHAMRGIDMLTGAGAVHY